jgi:hypothetical protein
MWSTSKSNVAYNLTSFHCKEKSTFSRSEFWEEMNSAGWLRVRTRKHVHVAVRRHHNVLAFSPKGVAYCGQLLLWKSPCRHSNKSK